MVLFLVAWGVQLRYNAPCLTSNLCYGDMGDIGNYLLEIMGMKIWFFLSSLEKCFEDIQE